MSSIGTGYDLSCTSYSPDGRVFQVEYAGKAVDNSGTAVALRCKDGIVLGVEKLILSKMLEEGSNRRIYLVDKHVGLCFAGLMADARQLVNKARKEAREYKSFYSDPIPGKVLVERLAGFIHLYTLYGHVRPFGCSVILVVKDKEGHHLYMVEPSGVSFGYYGVAIGKGKQAAKTEIEKLKLNELTCRQALVELAKIVHTVHDEVKDKDFELEMSWICEESGWTHQLIQKELLKETDRAAKEAVEAAMED